MSLHVFLLISPTMNEVFNNWIGPPSPSITSRHLFSILFSIGLQSGDLARSPGLIQCILQRAWGPGPTWVNVAYKLWSTVYMLIMVIEADSGPINYWTLHSLWCLLKENHGVTCNKWCNKVKHAWFPCYSCRSGHKSQKCEIFFHTFCHKMHDFTKTMPLIADIYHSFFA